MEEQVYLRIHNEGSISFVGSWKPANAMLDNFQQQQDLGWHIFMALQNGAEKVEVVVGDQDADHKATNSK